MEKVIVLRQSLVGRTKALGQVEGSGGDVAYDSESDSYKVVAGNVIAPRLQQSDPWLSGHTQLVFMRYARIVWDHEVHWVARHHPKQDEIDYDDEHQSDERIQQLPTHHSRAALHPVSPVSAKTCSLSHWSLLASGVSVSLSQSHDR